MLEDLVSDGIVTNDRLPTRSSNYGNTFKVCSICLISRNFFLKIIFQLLFFNKLSCYRLFMTSSQLCITLKERGALANQNASESRNLTGK